uniref:sphingomyelin phosphodiesterase n=1 Tax=Globisporangium ultimum (strain ATCC 200006 / CBS 805.95 / DAOM BR144) TaxID=431595 RepID=K3X9F7_GLOUD
MPQVDGPLIAPEYASTAHDPVRSPSARASARRPLRRAPASLPTRGLRPSESLSAIFTRGAGSSAAADQAAVDDGAAPEESEFVCYGDRVCFLCEGQLLALTRKFNLTYNQMALLVLLTLCSGGTFGIAGLLIWKKGLLRKRYAALFSDAIYADNASGDANDSIVDADGHPLAMHAKMNAEDSEYDLRESHRRSSMAETIPGSTTSGVDTAATKNASGNDRVDPRKPVTFRVFEYDAENQTIKLESVGKPVEFGAQVIVVHAATQRAIKYKPHRGAVTLSKPLKSLHFQKDVMANLPTLQKSSISSNRHSMPGERSTGGRFYRSMSEACMTFANDVQESIHDTLHRQRDDKKRVKQLIKDLPNMSFANSSGKYFVATVQPVKHHLGGGSLARQGTGSTGSSSSSGGFASLLPQTERFLRWGAPMAIIADYNGKACGIRPRQYYKDCQLYLTTETSQTTIIPLREDGDLQSMAKESTRLLAHIEKRQVQLSVGTYNVWMMPRIVSAFTSVSPKKNTRARLIADVLPPCDVWVFTECFDHRARAILLDKLKAAGYFYFSPTVGHKRLKRENMRKVLNGGVVLASKYPIVTVRIKLFKEACLGADKLADKGVLYCKILKDGLPVHIFSTHLQAWSDPLSRAMRRAQMVMIADFMRAMAIDEVNDPVLFVGDLNVNYWLNKTDHEYDEMLAIFNASDPSVVLQNAQRQTQQTDLKLMRQFSFDPRLNALAADGLSTDGSLELLDFVLYSKAHRQPSAAKSWIVPLTTATPWNWRKQPQYNLSDHFPVVSAFTFDM